MQYPARLTGAPVPGRGLAADVPLRIEPMPRAKRYTRDDVNAILHESEGRRSPVSGEPGHALSRHVAVDGYQISDRLRPELGASSRTRPIVMHPSGVIASEADHREIWRGLTPGVTTKTLKGEYRRMYEDYVMRSGSFLSLAQSVIVGRYLLNASAGQAELVKLDSRAEDRVAIELSMNAVEWIDGAWKMNYACHGNDITHLEDFSKAFMLVDRLEHDKIHVQTFFPVL
jgi:hypothetical protein